MSRTACGLVIGLCIVGTALVASPASAVTVGFDPSSLATTTGGTFSIDVVVTGVTDLFAWDATVQFDPALLSATGASEGPFLATGGATLFTAPTISNVSGTVSNASDILLSAGPGVTGSGTLFTIGFTALAPGASPLSLTDVHLFDSQLAPISFETQGSQVTVRESSAVPEPATLMLLAGGLLAAAYRRRRR